MNHAAQHRGGFTRDVNVTVVSAVAELNGGRSAGATARAIPYGESTRRYWRSAAVPTVRGTVKVPKSEPAVARTTIL